MGRCPSCGRESRHEFCEACSAYVGVPDETYDDERDEDDRDEPADDPAGTPALPPAAVLPGAAIPPPPVRWLGQQVARDVRCAACGVYGPDGRTFCAACGDAVAARPAEPDPPRPPWWRRAVRRSFGRAFRRRPAVVTGPIGPIPVLREPADRRWGLVALVVLPVIAVAAIPGARAAYHVATARYEPVRPSGATGPSVPHHAATRLVDGIVNTSWIGPPRSGHVVAVRVDFAAPVDVDRIGVTQGAGETPESYAAYQRVEVLSLVFDDGTTARVRLADKPGFQPLRVRARAVRWVRMTVVSRYPASAPRHGPALSEVEFFRLS
jgi:hypothetical protein